MRRREFIAGLGVLASWSLFAHAQRTEPWRISQIRAGNPDQLGPSATALEERLAEVGYVNGNNIVLLNRFVSPQMSAMEAAIQDLLPRTDILVVWGTVGAVAAKKHVAKLPVVFVSVGAPVDIGLVRSLAHPGHNLTGITFEAASETYAKRLQMLLDIVPSIKRVSVLHAHDDANVFFAMSSLRNSASVLGTVLLPIEVKSVGELPSVFIEMRRQGADALISVAGIFTAVNSKLIAELALEHRLPSCHGFKETVAAGGLISLGPDRAWMAKQAADYVHKIIRGAKPGDLPVQQPERYEVHVNLKTAKALGVTVPLTLLGRADEVIE